MGSAGRQRGSHRAKGFSHRLLSRPRLPVTRGGARGSARGAPWKEPGLQGGKAHLMQTRLASPCPPGGQIGPEGPDRCGRSPSPSETHRSLQLQHQGLDSAAAAERTGCVFRAPIRRPVPRGSVQARGPPDPTRRRPRGEDGEGESSSLFLQGVGCRVLGGHPPSPSLRPVGITGCPRGACL